MLKLNLLIILSLCVVGAIPAYTASRWFSSSWYDLRVALLEYGQCIPRCSADPILFIYDNQAMETFLVDRMKAFLDQASYEIEQLKNIPALMDNICQSVSSRQRYATYRNINVDVIHDDGSEKTGRCNAINEAMDAMYPILKRASLNKSEPIDFSVIQLNPIDSDAEKSYNLGSLIDPSWFNFSNHVCSTTGLFKSHIHNVTSKRNTIIKSTTSVGSHQDNDGFINNLTETIDKIVDPIHELQKQLHWYSKNRLRP